jgi:hypothetical protein
LQGGKEIHIAPDSFDQTWANITFSQLLGWALTPADDSVLRKLVAKGRADGVAWAQLTGVLDAAAPDPDDLYRYKLMQAVIGAAPPNMSPEVVMEDSVARKQ